MRLIDGDELCNHAMRNRPKVYHDIVDMVLDMPTVKNIRTVIPLNTYERLLALADKELIEVLQEIRQEINKINCGDKQEPFSRIAPKGFYITGDGVKEIVLEIIDNHISAWSGKEEGCV